MIIYDKKEGGGGGSVNFFLSLAAFFGGLFEGFLHFF